MVKTILKAALCALLGSAAIGSAQAAPIIGASIIVRNTGDVTATFLGSDAQFESVVGIQGGSSALFNNHTTPIGSTIDLGRYAVGTILTLTLHRLDSGETFQSGSASSNFDGVAHVSADYQGGGLTKLGFEDIRGGGDHDYNDLIVNFTNTIPSGVPEPLTWLMLITGFGGVGAAMRRQRGRTDGATAAIA